jgi:hypothetical protein
MRIAVGAALVLAGCGEIGGPSFPRHGRKASALGGKSQLVGIAVIPGRPVVV